MEKENKYSKTEINTSVNINKENPKEKEDINGAQEATMKAILKREKDKVMGFGSIVMVLNTKVNSKKIVKMDWVDRFTNQGKDLKVCLKMDRSKMDDIIMLAIKRYQVYRNEKYFKMIY